MAGSCEPDHSGVRNNMVNSPSRSRPLRWSTIGVAADIACVRAVMLTFDDFVTGTEQCGGMAKPAQRANAAMTRNDGALAA